MVERRPKRIAARWLQRQATNDLLLSGFGTSGSATLSGTGTIQDITQALANNINRHGIPSPQNVSRQRGALKAFSFHWSNAQAKWHVMHVRNFPWPIDGAEFVLFTMPNSKSPLGRPWTLVEMQYVARNLPDHPGFINAVDYRSRGSR